MHTCELSCECIHETPKAILVRFEDKTERWIPKWAIHDDSDVYKLGTDGNLVIDDRFAESAGLE